MLRPVYGQQQVYVIGHNTIFLNTDIIPKLQFPDLRFADSAKRAEQSPAPTDIG